MIGEKTRYHGVAFARLVQDSGAQLSIRARKEISRCAYAVNDDRIIFVKYATSRMSPWRFAFSVEHRYELDELYSEFPATWIVLVCGGEGILTVPWSEVLADLLNDNDEGVFSLQASRNRGEKFRLSGVRGRPLLVSENDFPSRLLA